ncbi:MAG: hypothetical protein LC541_07825 [Candidatus Thiodiazotropha sp.]|nr:hypothetical protein [Candidatus Thiodiazotropha sp.]MCM8883216.1 hypothetical protein [Candidatus Thiodiazotropha sp.]MCM8920611.1 hypothetical protein [Candidatus Thiodiazotropha sp.]
MNNLLPSSFQLNPLKGIAKSKLIIIILLSIICGVQILTGCTATTPKNNSNQTVGNSGFAIQFDNNIRATPRYTYYALMENAGDSQWRIVEIDNKPLKRRGFNSELIAIDLEEMRIWPDYTSNNVSRDGTAFFCMKGGHMSDKHKVGSYNGCNSNLIKARWTLERAWGEKVVVKPDEAKIASLLDATNLIREVQNCDLLRNDDENILSMIRIVPKVTDESGLYAGEELIKVKRYILGDRIDCPVKDSTHYTVSIREKPKIPYEISIVPRKYSNLRFESESLELHPQITIHRKTFNTLDISESLQGNELVVYIHRLSTSSGRPYVSFDIANKTNRYLAIRSLSIHLNNEVFTQSYDGSQMMIPPVSKATKTLRLPDKAANDIRVKLSRTEAERNTLFIGLSALYDDEGEKKTFYGKKEVKYSKVLNL